MTAADEAARLVGRRLRRVPRDEVSVLPPSLEVQVEVRGWRLSEPGGFDLDRSTARAWRTFQARLADHVADMVDDDVLVIQVESSVDEEEADGCAPYVQFCAWGGDLVRCEVSGNEYLADRCRLDAVCVATLEELGWSAPGCGGDDGDPGESTANFHLDVERSQADRLAVMTVKALRDVLGVAHPTFLAADNLGGVDDGVGASAAGPPTGPEAEAPLAVFPQDREHLQALVDEALTPFFGHVPKHDEDGDIPVVSGSGVVFVRVLDEVPAIEMFAPLVLGVSDLERAAFEVGVLNRDLRFVRFGVADDRVMASLHLPAWPFVPVQLRTMLALMAETVDKVDDDLAVRLGGRRALESEVAEDGGPAQRLRPNREPVHPALTTLLRLDADSPGSVDPELAAGVCGMDRDLVLELIARTSGMEHTERATSLLCQALRVIVEHDLGRRGAREPLPSRRPREGRRRSKASHAPADPSLEDLDPEVWRPE